MLLVNPVDVAGVGNSAINRVFRAKYPAAFAIYRKDAFERRLKLGQMHVVYLNGTFIVNFPTRQQPESKARLEDIEAGLDDLFRVIGEIDVSKIVIPALGCGSGGLKWADVRPLIIHMTEKLPELEFILPG